MARLTPFFENRPDLFPEIDCRTGLCGPSKPDDQERKRHGANLMLYKLNRCS
jgi:hypothetical protein